MTSDSTHLPSNKAKRSGGFLRFLRDIAVIVVVAIVISFVVKTFLVRSFYIPSGSMQQTLQIDDRILVNQLIPDLVEINRGDVIVFQDPGGWLPSTTTDQPSGAAAVGMWFLSLVGLANPDNDDHLIKRVIGLPGDRVECCDPLGNILVNGVPIDEPYIVIPPGQDRASGVDFSVTVPEDSLWVLGDNRYDSQDSRYTVDKPGGGFVPVENVVGRAFVINWPASRWEILGNYPEVFQGVPDSYPSSDAG